MYLSKFKINLFLLAFMMLCLRSFGHNVIRCSTMDVFNRRALIDTQTLQRRDKLEADIQQWILQNTGNKKAESSAIITIPVVVHVVWNTGDQNIPDAQIFSQIDRLNKDYRKLNTDMVPSGHPFYALAGNPGIDFCLTTIDPDGNATTGIIRKQTSVTEFSDNDDVKFDATGGSDAWDASQYLNIWVCKLGGDLLGYAQFPSDLLNYPESDGVVIGYTNFGTNNEATAPYDQGRTATHEIGHWLNLQHIWGDDDNQDGICDAGECSGSDGVSDTPNQCEATYGCPSGSFAVRTDSCTPSGPGYMYENYMDYTNDACMVMFTNGQVTRMKAVFNLVRASLVTSNKCTATTSVSQQFNKGLHIYPNPIQNYLTIEGLPKNGPRTFTIDIYNMIGEKVYSTTFQSDEKLVEMQDFRTGTYVLTIYNETYSATQKITVVR